MSALAQRRPYTDVTLTLYGFRPAFVAGRWGWTWLGGRAPGWPDGSSGVMDETFRAIAGADERVGATWPRVKLFASPEEANAALLDALNR